MNEQIWQIEEIPDPDPDGLWRHGGAQCPAMDGVYHCTLRAGHAATNHKTWSGQQYVRIWPADTLPSTLREGQKRSKADVTAPPARPPTP